MDIVEVDKCASLQDACVGRQQRSDAPETKQCCLREAPRARARPKRVRG